MTKKIIWLWRNRNGQENIRVPEHMQDFEDVTIREALGLWCFIVSGCIIWAIGIYTLLTWIGVL